jgi:hypothetical protein
MAALEVDVELLRDADRGAVADEVRALIDALDPSSEEISIRLVGGISSPDLGAIGQRLRELPNIKAVGFENQRRGSGAIPRDLRRGSVVP